MQEFIKKVLTVALILFLLWLGVKIYHLTIHAMRSAGFQEAPAATAPSTQETPGLPPDLKQSLEEAKKQGADGLRAWLSQHAWEVQDPTLAEIEMDYVVLVGPSDPEEARRVLERIGKRIQPDSPVYKRYEALCRAYFPEKLKEKGK